LSNICQDAEKGRSSQFDGVQSANFFWVSREPEDFVWVNHYNNVIHASAQLRDRIKIHLCLSKALEPSAGDDCTKDEIQLFWAGVQAALSGPDDKGLAKEMGAPTQFGRPKWEKEFADVVEKVLSKRPIQPTKEEPLAISVFACGNKMLVEALETACDASKTEIVMFRLFAEEF
jgi:hypothetical protein